MNINIKEKTSTKFKIDGIAVDIPWFVEWLFYELIIKFEIEKHVDSNYHFISIIYRFIKRMEQRKCA